MKNTCGQCTYYHNNLCYKNPPAPGLVPGQALPIVQKAGPPELRVIPLRPPVQATDKACGSFAPDDTAGEAIPQGLRA